MKLKELIELRSQQQSDGAGDKDRFYKGYSMGWKDAYDDIKTILRHYGFDIEQDIRGNQSGKN